MEYRIFLSIGNTTVEEKIRNYKNLVITDMESDLQLLKQIIPHIDVEFIIINSLLDDDGFDLIEVSKIAIDNDINVVILMNGIESFEEKKLVGALVNKGVNAFINLNELNEKDLLKILANYPKEFNFASLGNPEVKIIEKDKIIEKEVLKVTSYRSDSIITFLSNSSTGKTYLSWNLSYALSKQYKVALINIDNSSSANCFFGIDQEDMALQNSHKKTLKEIIDEGYRINKNLIVYTGEFGIRSYIKNEVLFKVINQLRRENNIIIIDAASGITDNLMTSINYSNDLIFVYDLDNSHFKLNNIMLKKLEDQISINNTTAVINNVFDGSKELENMKKHLKKLGFKDVLTVRNCGKTAYDYIYSDTCNYLKDNNDFTKDIDLLISYLKLQENENKFERNKLKFNIFKRRG